MVLESFAAPKSAVRHDRQRPVQLRRRFRHCRRRRRMLQILDSQFARLFPLRLIFQLLSIQFDPDGIRRLLSTFKQSRLWGRRGQRSLKFFFTRRQDFGGETASFDRRRIVEKLWTNAEPCRRHPTGITVVVSICARRWIRRFAASVAATLKKGTSLESLFLSPKFLADDIIFQKTPYIYQ